MKLLWRNFLLCFNLDGKIVLPVFLLEACSSLEPWWLIDFLIKTLNRDSAFTIQDWSGAASCYFTLTGGESALRICNQIETYGKSFPFHWNRSNKDLLKRLRSKFLRFIGYHSSKWHTYLRLVSLNIFPSLEGNLSMNLEWNLSWYVKTRFISSNPVW